jgi:hypothetical protein
MVRYRKSGETISKRLKAESTSKEDETMAQNRNFKTTSSEESQIKPDEVFDGDE